MKTKKIKKGSWKFKLHPVWKMSWTEFLIFLLSQSLEKDIKVIIKKPKRKSL